MIPDRPTVASMAPTCVAAININSTTIYTALSIPKESGDFVLQYLTKKRTQLRLTLSELKIIIDEMSMAAKKSLQHIQKSLTQQIQNYWHASVFIVQVL